MTEDRWQRLQELFEAALELPAERRKSFLEEACVDAPELEREVLELLESRATGAVDETLRQAASEIVSSRSSPGDRIGPYRLLEELGSGGMGTVYLAERADGEFDQQVAIKLVRAGALNPRIAERFKSERQILASLDHPNIARLIDGGSTDDGLPYFVMEYVDGEPIDRYCDEHQLSTNARLRLFREVCGAVEAAHRSLVVHRDLKPSNLLVTGDGVPKLLDFGIAKLLERDEEQRSSTQTRVGDRVMTPEYASPEQVRAQPVSTATDVYTLGLLLYEILTGHRAHQLSSYTPGEVERVVCDQSPERPSTVVTRETPPSESANEPTPTPEQLSEVRGTEPWKLKKRLAGELDNIVMMALRKEPERRYSSVAGLSDDIGRHLAGHPVEAHGDTLLYRTRKFIARNRAAVAVGLLALVIPVVLTVFYTQRLADERDLAERESERANRVADFLRSVFSISDPNERRGEEISVQELLDRGAQELRADSTLSTATRADMMSLMGEIYGKVGLFDSSEELLLEALELERTEHGAESAQAATANFRYAQLLREKGSVVEAQERLEEALELRSRVHGPNSAESAEVLSILGMALVEQGRDEEGGAMIRRAAEILSRDPAADQPGLATALHYLGNLAWARGDFAGAEARYREVLAIRSELYGEEHTEVGDSLHSIGVALVLQNRDQEAIPYYLRAEGIYLRRLGPEHTRVAGVLEGMAGVHLRMGELESAEAVYRRSLTIYTAATGPESLNAGIATAKIGQVLTMQGRFEEAIELGEAAVRTVAPLSSPRTSAWVEGTLAESYLRAGRLESAGESFERTLSLREEIFLPSHPSLAEPLLGLSRVRVAQRRPQEARELLERAVELLETDADGDPADLVVVRAHLGLVLVELEDCESARPMLDAALALIRSESRPQGLDPEALESARATCAS